MAMGFERRTLGATGIAVPALGVGAGTWGDSLQGYGKKYSEDDLYATYRASIDAGFNYFDTAPDYGRGESERLIGRFRKRDGRPVFIATKFENSMFLIPFRRSTHTSLLQELDASLERLGVERIDLYQIHLRTIHSSLAKRGIPLASNQVSFNVFNRLMMENGVLDTCRELNVSLIAYHPLAQGILTGKNRSGQNQLAQANRIAFRFLDAMFGNFSWTQRTEQEPIAE